jgi:ferric-dicitrate binding protein FerR (iron transport regulator)
VITGRVKLTNESKDLAVLTSLMQLQLNKMNHKIKRLTIDTASVLAWKKGRLQFQGQTLEEIAHRLENWYGYHIIFASPAMKSCRYYMTFSNSLSPEELFSAMSAVTEMEFKISHETKTVTLSGRECR